MARAKRFRIFIVSRPVFLILGGLRSLNRGSFRVAEMRKLFPYEPLGRITVLLLIILTIAGCYTPRSQTEKVSFQKTLSDSNQFTVIPFFSPYDEVDKGMIFEEIVLSFKEIGEVVVSTEPSLFKSLLLGPKIFNPALLSIGREKDHLKISLAIGDEKEGRSIWTKTLLLEIPQDSSQLNPAIVKGVKRLIREFSLDYSNLQNPQSKNLKFYIKNFEDF